MSSPTFTRFRAKYDATPGGCWIWTGATQQGGAGTTLTLLVLSLLLVKIMCANLISSPKASSLRKKEIALSL